MSIKKFLAPVTGLLLRKRAETVSYDALFKGEAAAPAGAIGNFLPGLRHVEQDVDVYFKQVFAGPVF